MHNWKTKSVNIRLSPQGLLLSMLPFTFGSFDLNSFGDLGGNALSWFLQGALQQSKHSLGRQSLVSMLTSARVTGKDQFPFCSQSMLESVGDAQFFYIRQGTGFWNLKTPYNFGGNLVCMLSSRPTRSDSLEFDLLDDQLLIHPDLFSNSWSIWRIAFSMRCSLSPLRRTYGRSKSINACSKALNISSLWWGLSLRSSISQGTSISVSR